MNFKPIRTATIRGNQPLLFNLYLHIRNREVLYIKKNDPIEKERLDRLKANKVKQVFIEDNAEGSYLEYIKANLNRLEDKTIPLEERSSIIEGQAISAVEDVFENPEKKETYDNGKMVIDKYVSFISNNKNAMGHLVNLKSSDFNSYQHSLNVSSLSIGLAMKMNVTDKKELDLLGMGALLHDIGKTKLPIDITKDIHTYNEEELIEFKKHPEVGADILRKGGFADRRVVLLVEQHEEYIDGTGYPKGLKKSQMDPLAHFISLANTYDRYITFSETTPKEAMKNIAIDKVGLFQLDHIKNLRNLLVEQGVF